MENDYCNQLYAVQVFKNVGNDNTTTSTFSYNVNPKSGKGFTYVAALGKTKEYSRVELIRSYFRGN